jgi:hypothetical protein
VCWPAWSATRERPTARPSKRGCGFATGRSGRPGVRSTRPTACGSKAGRSSSARRTGAPSWRSDGQRRLLALGSGAIARACSWASSQPSKLADRVRLPGEALKQLVVGVCWICTRPCEGRGPGSIPGDDTFYVTLEPDGQATGCNPVEAGSTPASVSDQPFADLAGKQVASDSCHRAGRIFLSRYRLSSVS